MSPTPRPLAVVTGASTGIGYDLARIAAASGYDLLIAADEVAIDDAAERLRADGGSVIAVIADLSTAEGVDRLLAAAEGRAIDVLCANAGTALGRAFLDQPMTGWRHVVDTNVFGTTYLLHRALTAMIARGQGRVLVTGSINGSIPGPFLAVYNATKAYINNLTDALRNELRDAPVTLTTLMPGPVQTPVYARAGMLDTAIGAMPKPASGPVAQAGWDAMMRGDAHIVPGIASKMAEAMAHVTPAAVMTAAHRMAAQPHD